MGARYALQPDWLTSAAVGVRVPPGFVGVSLSQAGMKIARVAAVHTIPAAALETHRL
jgi:hypothetical protein